MLARMGLILAICLLSGCGLTADKGGGGAIENSITTKETYPDGRVVEKVELNNFKLDQPENASKAGSISIDRDNRGNLNVGINTGTSYNTSSVKASFELSKVITYCGIALILFGGGVFFVTKQLTWSLAFGAIGIGLVVASYLLLQYSFIILVASGIAVAGLMAYLGYMIYNYVILKKANKENVRLIDVVKGKLGDTDQEEVFKSSDSIARNIQSPTTRKIVQQIKMEKKLNG